MAACTWVRRSRCMGTQAAKDNWTSAPDAGSTESPTPGPRSTSDWERPSETCTLPKFPHPAGVRPIRRKFHVRERRTTEMPLPGENLNPGTLRVTGIEPRRLRALGRDTWVYAGDMHLEQPVVLHSNLVVDGSLSAQPGSLLEGDVEIAGSLALGADSVAMGNLSAAGDLVLESRCIFQGDLLSGQLMRLGAGVRGIGRGRAVKSGGGRRNDDRGERRCAGPAGFELPGGGGGSPAAGRASWPRGRRMGIIPKRPMARNLLLSTLYSG